MDKHTEKVQEDKEKTNKSYVLIRNSSFEQDITGQERSS